jgi:hypothetical protein
VHGEDAVFARQLDCALEQAVGDDRSGRVVGVIEEHQPRASEGVGRDRVEIRRKSALGPERQQLRLRARQQRAPRVDRIAGVGRERDITRIEERKVEVEDAFLGADRRHHLGLGVKRDPEATRIESRDGLAELAPAAIGRVLVGAGIRDGALRRCHDRLVGRHVRIADPEADHVHPSLPLRSDLALELGEQIRRDPLKALTRSHVAPLRTRR